MYQIIIVKYLIPKCNLRVYPKLKIVITTKKIEV